MKVKALASAIAIAVATLGVAGGVQAQDSKFVVKLGVANVMPKSNNGRLNTPLGNFKTDIGNSARPSITFEYLITPNIGVELLGAWPFRNDIKFDQGVGQVGRVDVLPPTLSVKYHFMPQETISPFVGLGLNYTFMYSEKERGAIAGTRLNVKNSFGLAANIGVDFNIDKNWLIGADLRWIQMRNKVDVDIPGLGHFHLGKAKVDPWVLGVAVGYRF